MLALLIGLIGTSGLGNALADAAGRVDNVADRAALVHPWRASIDRVEDPLSNSEIRRQLSSGNISESRQNRIVGLATVIRDAGVLGTMAGLVRLGIAVEMIRGGNDDTGTKVAIARNILGFVAGSGDFLTLAGSLTKMIPQSAWTALGHSGTPTITGPGGAARAAMQDAPTSGGDIALRHMGAAAAETVVPTPDSRTRIGSSDAAQLRGAASERMKGWCRANGTSREPSSRSRWWRRSAGPSAWSSAPQEGSSTSWWARSPFRGRPASQTV